MSSNWETVKLGDVTKFQQGKQIELEDQFLEPTNEMLRFVRIIDYTSENEPPRYIKADKKSSSYVTDEDVVMIRYGSQTAGKVVIGKAGIIANNMFRVIPTVSYLDRKYLYFYLKTPSVYSYLRGGQSSSTMPAITFGLMSSLDIKIPPLPIQKKIAHILSTLDDKIELNRKMNQTLESMASAIFKSWFVDFDPVHAKANCEEEAELENIAKELGISKTILDIFPSEFEESELGMIPKGWEVKTIKDFGRVVTGKTPPSKIEDAYNDDGKPFITPTDIDDSLFLVTTNRHLSANGEIAIKNTIIPAGSICVTCIGSQMGKTIISPYDACTNQQINSIIVNSNNLRNYLFCNLRNRKNEIFLMGSGGSTMPLLNKSTFEKMKVLLPQQDILNKFDILVKDKLLLVLKNDLENITLSKIRNNLLPKLLSGEIEV